jgi:outer membrane receptor for ferrienterochelin and colicin
MSYDVIFDYPFAKHAKVSAAVYNVFDKRIYTDDLFGYSELGRRFDVTATFGF